MRYCEGMEAHHNGHRDISGGGARAAVFGVSDGLLSNVALILGVAGAHPAPKAVVIAGLAGLVAGAFSMGVGEYISMGAQRELFEHELRIEATEIRERPDAETRELTELYVSRGVPKELAAEVSDYLMRNPDTALQVHAQEELGVAPDSVGSPIQAALASFFSFAIGALIPLVAWFVTIGSAAVIASAISAGVASLLVGGGLAAMTGRSVSKGAARQFILSAVAALVTYGVGHFLGATIR
ncbi:VIT1/CCC1 transporter family protein [Ferrimicrobium acidiphilum]|uniref:VIT1/CCC1 transporter family protein n=1 Tax=Ferrimicrobium acidiphilum TaxID=121039 RepID=UPI001F2BF5D5|nr:VIT1/CCC1 transporter family protein [Ferrimicrobium acidiphilum]